MTGDVLAQERATLQPDPRSASAARRLVRRLLAENDRDEWTDAAELAVSEVVSNAVLHAHTEVEVEVRVLPDAVRVDVLDHSPLLPVQRAYGEHATTGRGLGLVAALAERFGIDSHEGDGKTVWFYVGSRDGDAAPDLDAWDDEAWDLADVYLAPASGASGPDDTRDAAATGTGSSAPEPEAAHVALRDLPVSLWLAAQQHHDALLREYVLALSGADAGGWTADRGGSPARAAVQAADDAQGMLAAAVERALERAAASGVPVLPLPTGHPSPLPEVPATLDVDLVLDPASAESFAALQDSLDAAERLAADGALLARPALPEVVAVRDWACEQVIAQVGGVAASRWPGLDSEHVRLVGPVDALHQPDWDPTLVREADRPVVAADESNRILAVSEPLGRLVGWDPDDLVGRRVVALIPPRLRELHVAGFTRHLTTGQASVLGVPLELPVLHADGHELLCWFLVERVPDTGSRAVYLAWISEPDRTEPPGPTPPGG